MASKSRRPLIIELKPQYVTQDEMTDIIIQALWGSRESAAREFLSWEEKRKVSNDDC